MAEKDQKKGPTGPQSLALEDLEGRLYVRPEFGNALALDLRGKAWGNQGRQTLRNPADPGWPAQGRTTSDRSVAKRWIESHYLPQIAKRQELATAAPADSGITAAEAVERYIKEKSEALGADHDTVRNRKSALRKHFVSAFGERELVTITKAEIRTHLNKLEVQKRSGGRTKTTGAEMGTKRTQYTAYLALWKHVLPDIDCPWEGIHLNADTEKRALRDKIKAGSFEDLLQPESGALSPAQVVLLLLAAMWYDLHQITAKANTSKWAVANTAAGIALQIATGMRKSELVLLRWWMINFDEGYIRVPAMKGRTESKKGRLLRAIPLQKQLLPWLEILKRLACPDGGEPDRMAFVLRTNALRNTPPTRKTLGERFGGALILSGLKQPKKQTHGFRATHATWGAAAHDVVSAELLKAFLGHATVWLGATDNYVEMMVALMTPGHRTYIRHLPSPEEVEAALANFKPTPDAITHLKAKRSRKQRAARKR